MSDNDQDPDRIADRRAEKLSRAIEVARAKRAEAGAGKVPTRPSAPRRAKLPPPPPVDPEDLKALGIPVPPHLREVTPEPEPEQVPEQADAPVPPPETVPAPTEPVTPPVSDTPQTPPPPLATDQLLLGTGPTRVLGADDLQFDDVPEPELRPIFTSARATPLPSETAKKQPEPLLRLEGLYTDIGRYRILQGVDLLARKGQVTMLLGRNGVGKTTTLRSVMGLWKPRQGNVWFDGVDLAGKSPAAIARAGIGYVPEDMGIFGDLTVEENMKLGALSGRMDRTRIDWLTSAFPALRTFWNKPAATLSGGQKQMLSIARILVEPRDLYLIDEPTKGLAPAIVTTLAAALRALKNEGATILMVEQNFSVAKALGDACVVMDDGRAIWSGDMATLAESAELQSELMGLQLEAGH